jgi:hypothetical protein
MGVMGWKELFHQTARPTTHRPCIAVNHGQMVDKVVPCRAKKGILVDPPNKRQKRPKSENQKRANSQNGTSASEFLDRQKAPTPNRGQDVKLACLCALSG